jgi:hypothetical protein
MFGAVSPDRTPTSYLRRALTGFQTHENMFLCQNGNHRVQAAVNRLRPQRVRSDKHFVRSLKTACSTVGL